MSENKHTIIEDKSLGVTFHLPNRPTVRQMLEFEGAVGLTMGEDVYLRYWQAAAKMIDPESWKCKLVDLGADLSALDDLRVVEVVKYVALTVSAHVVKIKGEALEKNA